MGRARQSQIAEHLARALEWPADTLMPPASPLFATLSTAANSDAWVVVYGDMLEFAFNGDNAPEVPALRMFDGVTTWTMVDWSPGRFVTIQFGPVKLDDLARAIDSLFGILYWMDRSEITCSVSSFGRA